MSWQEDLASPMKKGKCFSCGKQGHWAAECPNKVFSQPIPNPSGRLASLDDKQGYSEVICRCGAGVCKPRVAKTNGKVYYGCPAAESWMRCDFFMWLHKLESSSIKRLEFPICECGAGVCVLGREAATGREYFKCRVPKGHGACSFRQWLDDPASHSKRVTAEETYQVSTPPRLGKQATQSLFPISEEDDSRRKCVKITELDGLLNTSSEQFSSNSTALFMSSDMKEGSLTSSMELDGISPKLLIEIMEYDYPLIEDDELSCKQLKIPELEENIVDTSAQMVSLGSSNRKEIPPQNETAFNQFDTDEDFINEVIAFESTISDVSEPVEISRDCPMQETVDTAFAKLHKRDIVQLRQANFEKGIVAAATDIPQEKRLSVTLGAQYLGWLCGLAFASPKCLISQLDKCWCCCIFPNFDPIYVPQGLGQFHGKTQTVLQSIDDKSLTVTQEDVVEDVPSIIVKELSAPGSPPYVAKPDNGMAAAILEAFGKAAVLIQTNFITCLESMNPWSHESMRKGANTVFASLDHLKVDYRAFHYRVKDFIEAVASLNHVELSICNNNALFQDTLDCCNQEKLCLEQLSSEHASVMNSFTRSQERVQSLLNEAQEVRNRLLQIEQQVSACQLETNNLNSRLAELSEQINECKNNVRSASREAEAAQKLSLQKEAELSAAWVAFEKAKFQLRDRDGGAS